MGMFDSVYVKCPHCAGNVEFQSKEWGCQMDVWTLEVAPSAVLHDIMNWPNHCGNCDGWFALIDPNFPPGPPPRPDLRAEKVKTPDNPLVHSQGMKWWPDEQGFSYSDLTTPLPSGQGKS